MRARTPLALLGLLAGSAAACVAAFAPAAVADAPTRTAWFTAATAGPLTVPVPTTDPGDLRVGGSGDRPTAYATLHLVASGASGGTLTLAVRPNTAAGTVAVAACTTKKADWKAGGNQPFPGPEYDCDAGADTGTVADDGLSVTFPLDEATQSAPGTWDIAIAPDPATATAPFTVDFTKPDATVFTPQQDSGSVGALPPPPPVTVGSPSAEPEASSGPALTAGSDTPAQAPDTAPLEAPGPQLAGAETAPLAPQTADDSAGQAPVTAGDPAQQTGAGALPATQPVAAVDDVTSRERVLAFLALLTVVAAAAYAAGQPSPLPQLLGGRARANPTLPAEVAAPRLPQVLARGIGRFSRVREAAPRRLR